MTNLVIRIKHNIATYDLQLPLDSTVGDLSTKILELTGVPVSGQKIICCGKTFTRDQSVLLTEVRDAVHPNRNYQSHVFQAGIVPGVGNKLMVLGKKFDPASDESYKQLISVESKAVNAEKKVSEIAVELEDIDKGHLDKNLHQEAFKSLQKRVKSLNEELQKMLESLDGLTIGDDQLGS